MRNSKSVFSFLIVLLCWVSTANSAMHFIRPGAAGNNNGSDWTNAYTSLPPSLVRGDTYYLAAGNYGSYVFDDPASGSTLITLKKAIASDHGTEVGWNSTYGDGQAIFTGTWQFYTDYYLIDGQIRNGDWTTGGINQYGIRVKSNGSQQLVELDNRATSSNVAANNLTFRYVDFEGNGRDNTSGDDIFYSNAWALSNGNIGPRNITIQYCALHDTSRTIFLTRQWDTLLVEYSYVARNSSDPVNHGEIMSDDGSDNITFRYNILEDPEGTAVWAVMNGSGSKSDRTTATNWKIYGNIISHTTAYITAAREGISGVVFVDSAPTGGVMWADNWKIYNNTIANIQGTWSGFVMEGTGNSAINNIWYNSVRTNNSGSGLTFASSWYFNTLEDGDSGDGKIICTTNCNIFSNIANKDFRLTTQTPVGTVLPSPFDLDLLGNVRGDLLGWSRGAYQYLNGNMIIVLKAPTNLRMVP
ncbi:MAG: hypothetical protein ACXVB4_03930 [Pseudobdellovibrionaceae bacterium]